MAPLGIIAGLGELPVAVARNAVESGQGVFVLRLKGFEEPALAEFPGKTIGMGEIGKAVSAFKEAGCTDLVFAGIVKRPNFKDLKLDLRGAALLPKVVAAAGKGDDALLRVLVQEFEKSGFNILGSHTVHESLLAPQGLIAGPQPSPEASVDIERAAEIINVLGRYDIGQGCVVCDGLVLAVEAQEGTDQMLKRCASLPEEVRGTPDKPRGVLVKRPKPEQERRIDLPTSGVSTVEHIAAAGLEGLALEAGAALMLSKSAMIETANRLNVFIFGFKPGSDQ